MQPLPVYIADKPAGGIQVFRGEENPARVFTSGSQLTLVVRPQQPVTGKVEAQAFLARGNEWIPWRPEIEIAENGSVRLRGELGGEIQPGDWRLWVVVGRPGELPSLDELQAEVRAGRTRDDQWQEVSANLRVVSQPPT
jgi:hypothetical protein